MGDTVAPTIDETPVPAELPPVPQLPSQPRTVYWVLADTNGNITQSGSLPEGFSTMPQGAEEITAEDYLAHCGLQPSKLRQNGQWADLPPPVVPVPQTVSMAKAQIVMHNTPGSATGKSLLDDVNTAIVSANNMEMSIAWEKSAEVTRNGRFVQQLVATLGLDATAVDNLFRAADAYQL